MRYILKWSEEMCVFVLTALHDMQPHILTEGEFTKHFGESETLTKWAAFAKENAGRECVYDFLPG